MAKGARSWGSCCAGARLWVGRRRKRMRAAVLVGTGVAGAVQISNDITSAEEAEPPRAEAAQPVQEEPAATADGQQGSAARPEGRKRGQAEDGRKARGRRRPSPGKGRSRCLTASAI